MLTFTRTTPGTLDETTGRYSSPSTSTIVGTAIKVRSNPDRYRDLGLSIEDDPTFLFTPAVYPLKAHTPEFVMPGDTCVFNGRTFSVNAVDPVAPDGFVIVARVMVTG